MAANEFLDRSIPVILAYLAKVSTINLRLGVEDVS